ncbi:Ohr family peroxiredoxin [Actinacidiphila acidipaludis]|uniref:Ohr family peroxiredoxin n=1 Tax=Actinacidiphila acidipaludis TaxID=2873382 RepID=A0ABS7PYW1_9ACTN|nr:Ohr family peroxiredoxin [Streptomyces acidipaludis]MBY8876082.1 Ohr family peroxiredoxin [Streptomyces acidipaludis]
MTQQDQLPDLSIEKDYDGPVFSPIYTTTVTVEGGAVAHGRASGRARSSDGALDITLGMPTELGGGGAGTNPEQLFAAGFAACFHGALSLLARRAALDPTVIAVDATVVFGRDPEDGGYQLRVALVVKWPAADPEVAHPLLDEAFSLCPYARMAVRGTPVTVTLSTEAAAAPDVDQSPP